MRRTTAVLTLLGCGSALLIAALAFAAPSGAKTTDATIEHYMFMPDSITIAQGDAIVWTNQDDAPHTVTSQSGPAAFDSGNLAKGQSYSVTFSTPGSYSYYCSIHPDMKGKVTVTPASSSSSSPPTTATTPPPSHDSAPPPSQSAAPPPSAATPPEQCESVAAASLDPFVVHLDHAHLEESPGQQANDLLNVNQYVKTHTVLLEQMTAPTTGAATGAC